MELSMATDYASDTGDAEPYLRRIAEAGFPHIQWIHHWQHDFIYTEPEVEYIRELLVELNLTLCDIHAPTGAEKNWFSTVEYQRRAGVVIMKNRIQMCHELGGAVIVAHIPPQSGETGESWAQLRASVAELEEFCRERGVRIAVENRAHDGFEGIRELLASYDSQYLGLCYDSGHGNIDGAGLEHLDTVKDRLISVHLHDNDGHHDQHMPMFSGTVDWSALASLIAASSYDGPLTVETDIRLSGYQDERQFLASACSDGLRFAEMIGAV